jgi:hypothetical protein
VEDGDAALVAAPRPRPPVSSRMPAPHSDAIALAAVGLVFSQIRTADSTVTMGDSGCVRGAAAAEDGPGPAPRARAALIDPGLIGASPRCSTTVASSVYLVRLREHGFESRQTLLAVL